MHLYAICIIVGLLLTLGAFLCAQALTAPNKSAAAVLAFFAGGVWGVLVFCLIKAAAHL